MKGYWANNSKPISLSQGQQLITPRPALEMVVTAEPSWKPHEINPSEEDATWIQSIDFISHIWPHDNA